MITSPRKTYFSRCVPVEEVESTAESLYETSGISDFLHDAVTDVKLAWVEILYMCLIALGKAIYIDCVEPVNISYCQQYVCRFLWNRTYYEYIRICFQYSMGTKP